MRICRAANFRPIDTEKQISVPTSPEARARRQQQARQRRVELLQQQEHHTATAIVPITISNIGINTNTMIHLPRSADILRRKEHWLQWFVFMQAVNILGRKVLTIRALKAKNRAK